MNENNNQSPLRIVASVVSDVFSPLLVPTYAMAVALFLTRLHYLPMNVRLWSLGAVFGITCLVPLVTILILMRLGKVSDASISDRRQRTIPYCITTLCYVCAAYYVALLQAPHWLFIFFFGGAVVAFVSLIITRFWKISAHTGGVGGLAAIIYWLAAAGYIDSVPLVWASVAILLVGVVAWSRLYLSRHTLAQVFAGAVLSFAIVYTMLELL